MKKVLVIGYVWPEPNSSAAGTHMLSLLRLYKSQGWVVEFATPAQESIHMVDLSKEGISSQSIVLNCDSFDRYITNLSPDIVMFDRYIMEEQFGWRVDKCTPLALKILDTEDLQCLRNARHHAVKSGEEMTQHHLFSDIAKREIASILRCDISLIISSYEMKLLQDMFKVDANLLHHLPFMVDLQNIPSSTNSFFERKDFMCIGNFRHAPNWDMVLYLQEIWPLIKKQIPEAKLHIYGSYPPPKATALHNIKKGFLVEGWTEDAYLSMEKARVCLAPLRFGAGIKGKLLDAMITQTPSVTSSIGSEGMNSGKSWGGMIADDIKSFVDASVLLYSDEKRWIEAQKDSVEILQNNYNKEILGKKLIYKILSIQSQLEKHRLNNFTGAMLKHHSMASTKYMSQWIAIKQQIGVYHNS